MSRQAQVLNEGATEYVEEWNGKTYRIPAKGKITLNRNEAVNFMGRHPGYYPHNYPDPILKGTLRKKPLTLIDLGFDSSSPLPPTDAFGETAAGVSNTAKVQEPPAAPATGIMEAIAEKDRQIEKLEGQLNRLAGLLEKSGVLERTVKK